MEDGNELSIIKDILDGNIKKLDLDRDALNDMHNFLTTHKKEVMQMILSSEKANIFQNKLDSNDVILSQAALFIFYIVVGGIILLSPAVLPMTNIMIIEMVIGTIIPSILINTRILEKLYQSKWRKAYARLIYNNLVERFTNNLDKPIKENYQSEILTDSFLQEIYSTIKDIQYNSYETAKEELLSLQTLALEYISYQNNNTNLELSLTNQKDEFTKRLDEIEDRVSSKQQTYKIKNVLRVIDKLIVGEKVTLNQKSSKGINVSPYRNIFKEAEESLDKIDQYNNRTSRNWSSPSINKEMEKVTKYYKEINKHNFKYTFWSYIYKYKKPNWISGLLFAIINPFLAFSSGHIIITSLVSAIICYLVPSMLIGKHNLNKELKKMESYMAEHKGYMEEQKIFKSVLKTGYEINRDKRIDEIKENFKNKKVDSFIKDLFSDIEYIKAHPYKDCEQDIVTLNEIARDYAEFTYQYADNATLKINQDIYDFYERQYEIEMHMYQSRKREQDIIEINKALKEALNKPETDNYLINNDVFIKDIIKVINAIKANDYPYSNNELQEARGILVNYLNWKLGSVHTYEEINSEMKKYYYQLNNVVFKVKNKQKISDNIEDIDDITTITINDGIKLDNNLNLDVNKLELKLK